MATHAPVPSTPSRSPRPAAGPGQAARWALAVASVLVLAHGAPRWIW